MKTGKTNTWDWVAKRLPLLNLNEVARQAGVPRHRIADAERGRAKLSDDDLARIIRVVTSLR